MDAVLGLVRHAGNDALFQALEMSVLAAAAGVPLHVHAEGLRGTGKTSIMRAVRTVLPRIRRIKGCLYNCDPAAPHCPQHRGLPPEAVRQLGEELVPMPFLEISHSAKVGTVVGSIDLSRLVNSSQPEAALLPGSLPQAHRGILFVDEINRLAETSPELADVLLDVMGTKPGRIQIEETGLPAVELPVQVTVWAASNPDEDPGPLEEIRRQLSDRFDFVVYTDRPTEAAVVERILTAVESRSWRGPQLDEGRADGFRRLLEDRAALVEQVRLTVGLRQQIAELYSRFQVESLRAVQALQFGMRLAAALDRREAAGLEDLARVAPLALRHRVDPETLKRVAAYLTGLANGSNPAAPLTSRPRMPSVSFGGAAVQNAGAQGARRDGAAPAAAVERTGEAAARSGEAEAAARGTDAHGAAQPERSTSEAARIHPLVQAALPQTSLQLPSPSQQSPASAAVAKQLDRGWLARALSRLRRRGRRGQAGEPEGQRNLGGGYWQGASRSGAPASRATMADPLTAPPAAPPCAARPITQLQPHELVRTEEELGKR